MTVVWLNGGFGVGKTTTAALLAERPELGPHPFVLDPEIVGTALARSVPPGLTGGDFQSLPMWLDTVVATTAWVDERVDGAVVVPMTILDADRWERLRRATGDRGVDLVTVFLAASEPVLRERILQRPTEEADHDWCLGHIAATVAAGAALAVDALIATDDRTPAEVAAAVVGTVRRRS